MTLSEIRTWEDLYKSLAKLTDEQLRQPIQVVKSQSIESKPVSAMPGLALGTVEQMEFFRYRSAHNNKYCGSDVVLLVDRNPFAQSGCQLYEMKGDDFIPIYDEKHPKTSIKEQTAPNYDALCDKWEDGMLKHAALSLMRRVGEI